MVNTPDLADLAASQAYGLARNHAFVDGNKPTAKVGHRVFLVLNNAQLIVSDTEKIYADAGSGRRQSRRGRVCRLAAAHMPQIDEYIHEPLARYRKIT